MTPTSEQNHALGMALSGKSCKISAYAGAGKTSTLKLISDNRRDTGLYLAFNKTIATEASKKFNPSVVCKTFHSMAYTGCPKWMTAKLLYKRTFPITVASKYGFTQSTVAVRSEKEFLLRYGTHYTFSTSTLGAIVINSVGVFCKSIDLEVNINHVFSAIPEFVENSDRMTLARYLLEYSKLYWQDICSEKGNYKVEHDHYLKYWSLKNPRIRADYILFDEAQDADPIMLDVLSKQNAQVIYVGDKHQQIYGFRGAVNAMAKIEAESSYLTESFRFGDQIANIANRILSSQLSETKRLVGQSSIPSKVGRVDYNNCDAVITRTNVKALEAFVKLSSLGKNPKLEFDTVKLSEDLRDYKLLKEGKNVGSKSMFHGFSDWNKVLEYSEEVKNTDIKQFVSIVTKYGAEDLGKALTKNVVGKTDCTVLTAHKSKGMEYNNVILEDDFFYELKDDVLYMNPHESRLLYVACTRAKLSLDISNLDDIFTRI